MCVILGQPSKKGAYHIWFNSVLDMRSYLVGEMSRILSMGEMSRILSSPSSSSILYLGRDMTKPVFGVSPQLQRLARNFKFRL